MLLCMLLIVSHGQSTKIVRELRGKQRVPAGPSDIHRGNGCSVVQHFSVCVFALYGAWQYTNPLECAMMIYT